MKSFLVVAAAVAIAAQAQTPNERVYESFEVLREHCKVIHWDGGLQPAVSCLMRD